MTQPSSNATGRPLPADVVRRILESLDDLTQGNARTARRICALLGEDGKTTIGQVEAIIPAKDPRDYMRKFKTRFNQDADGVLTVVFDGRRGPDVYFTGIAPQMEEIAEFSERQTDRYPSPPTTINTHVHEYCCGHTSDEADDKCPLETLCALVPQHSATSDTMAHALFRKAELTLEGTIPIALHADEGAPVAKDARPRASASTAVPDTANVVERLVAWARGETTGASQLCALLGDVGAGKTTTSILLTRKLLELRHAGEDVPLPIFFDLRNLSMSNALSDGIDVSLQTILARLLASSTESAISVEQFKDAVRTERTLIIIDSLDEVLVHLEPGDGHRLIRSLLDILTLTAHGDDRGNPRTRLLLACRTQYFRSVEEKFSFFDTQRRHRVRGSAYTVFTLLPFDEKQIRDYLHANLKDENTDQLLLTIRSVHNLRELASQPVLLDMIRETLPTTNKALTEGRTVRSVDLYESFVSQWLRRDDGKHNIIADHKLLLMTHLAWEVWRSGSRTWSASWMEEWMLEFIDSHEKMKRHYTAWEPDLWKQDLRTATFLTLRNNTFSFAHSSLLEYFLAVRLSDSLLADSPEDALAAWDITRPSSESFGFFTGLVARFDDTTRSQAITRLERVGRYGNTNARRNVFSYILQAMEQAVPHPLPSTLDLSDTDLRGWTIGSKRFHLDLSGVPLRGARLDDARIDHVRLDRADVSGASMRRTLYEHCTLTHTNFTDADLSGTVFRHCDLEEANLADACRHRTQLLHTFPADLRLTDVLTAPAPQHGLSDEHSEIHVFGGHSDTITAMEWAPEADFILTGSDDGNACIWDATTGENILALHHDKAVNAVAWSPDGRRILTGSNDSTAYVWDATSGEKIRVLTHTKAVNAVAWSPDGEYILTGSDDGNARVWDATTGENILALHHDKAVNAVAWSPDGEYILTGSEDSKATVWDAESGGYLHTLNHGERILSVSWLDKGHTIRTGSADGTIRLWNAETGDNVGTDNHTRSIAAMAWSPDGKHILTASRNGIVDIWDGATGWHTRSLTYSGWVTTVAWSSDGQYILTGSRNHTVRVWDATTGDRMLTLSHSGWITSVAWSSDGRHILTGSDDRKAHAWDATTGHSTLTLTHGASINAVAWSPDHTRILTGSSDHSALVWDVTTGRASLRLTHSDWVTSVAWSKDGTRILTGSADRTACIWDAATGEMIRMLPHDGWVRAVAWSHNSDRILTGSDDNTARVWNAATGEMIRMLPHGDWVRAVAWSHNSDRILTGSDDNTARVWNAATGEEIHKLHHGDWVRAVAWSPDDDHILTGSPDGTARIWDATTLGPVRFVIATLPKGECAVLTTDQTQIIGASAGAWRWLGRYAVHEDGVRERIPVEIDGPLPPLSHGTTTE